MVDIPKTNGYNIIREVRLPSEKHVAQVVGKEGKKIKKIIRDTNTYIKSPKIGEEPIFKIHGFWKKVNEAELKILLISKNYSYMEEIKNNPIVEEKTQELTIEKFFSLIVGKNKYNINEIGLKTNTRIISPPNQVEPYKLIIIGSIENIKLAWKMIKDYIHTLKGEILYCKEMEQYEDPIPELEWGKV